MPRLLKNRFAILILAAVIALTSIIAVTIKERHQVSPAEGIIGDILAPIQKGVYTFVNGIRSFIDNVVLSRQQGKDISQLQQRINELQQENQRLKELEEENQRLKNMLDFKEANPQLVTSGARVIAKNAGNWFETFVIDKGSSDGIAVDMAVITAQGLAGRVMEVADHWAKVMAIIDERSSVSIIADKTRDNGVARGMLVAGSGADADLLKILYLPLDSKLNKGDEVITSGLGGVFPKGIPVGVVQEVKKTLTGEVEYAMVKPHVDFLRIEEVMVIKSPVENIEVGS
ncbi:rod shape-determining protein MreC [Mahella australiensis]|uniref:Cell shape-determining protein MreC n=1 Tax=Mahella australiensis (strain DSM 15567 / CIP 107919 / 50-1 BON) TaxID=697281 RepID=F3ZZK4_MAHA5|nr:rod shape-determining protein MreC [Mahella australiensis]AEE96830.1 rod shape-determining protein MreC [Mahella australiensis 50-1 BON]